MKTVILLLILCPFLAAVQAQPGTLDPSFGNEGIVTTDLPEGPDFFSRLKIQKDQKIIVLGDLSYSDAGIILERYLPDGTLDSSFGENGIVNTRSHYFFNDLALQNDGKILIGGNQNVYPQSLVLMRFLPDGNLDSTFGENGMVIGDFGGWKQSAGRLAIQPDGKIVTAGNFYEDEYSIADLVTRYNPDGSLDKSFGQRGFTIIEDGVTAPGLALQQDGKIVIGGSDYTGDNSHRKFYLARLTPEGSLDSSFDGDGQVFTDFGKDGDYISDIAIQPDGRIVAVGSSGQPGWNGTIPFIALARYNTDGRLDQSFGEGGKVSIQLQDYSQANAVALQQNGKIVITGFVSFENSNYVVARLLENGSLDPAFGTGGITITEVRTTNDRAMDVDLQKDGKIVVGGSPDITLARYIGDSVNDHPLITKIKTWIRNNLLHWYVANAGTVNYYSIESSSDSNRFTELKRIKAENASALISEAQSHQQQALSYVLSEANNNTYYRIAAIKKDGGIVYSDIVFYKGDENRVTIYPNPVRDILTLQGFDVTKRYNLQVMDIMGNPFLSATVQSANTYNWNIGSLKKGHYMISISTPGETEMRKFIKE